MSLLVEKTTSEVKTKGEKCVDVHQHKAKYNSPELIPM
jgi:hypothetical protein